MNCAITVLAKGDEHISEFNRTFSDSFEYNLFVVTDHLEKIVNSNAIKIFDGDEFNFNQKLIPIDKAFQNHDVVISLDTDILFRQNLDFTQLELLEDGLYVNWAGNVQKYKNSKVSINQILTGNSSFTELNDYGQVLIECGANLNNISFFDEFIFMVKLTNPNDKSNFIHNWRNAYQKTIKKQPKDRHYGLLNGAVESLIITLSCYQSNIKIFENNQVFKNIYHSIVHYGSENINKTLI